MTPTPPPTVAGAGPGHHPASWDDFASVLTGHVSDSALKKRIERLVKPRSNGKSLVPKELAEQWQNGDQAKLLEEFKKAAYNKDYNMCEN